MRNSSCHSFSALLIDLLSFIGRFEIDLTSIFLNGYLQDLNWNNSTWDASYIMYELQILHAYTISNVNYHKPESLKTQAYDRVV